MRGWGILRLERVPAIDKARVDVPCGASPRARLKANTTLARLLAVDTYASWIRSVAELTAHAFSLGAVAQHSAHYLLLFWTKMVIASAAVVQSAGATAHSLEQLLPQARPYAPRRGLRWEKPGIHARVGRGVGRGRWCRVPQLLHSYVRERLGWIDRSPADDDADKAGAAMQRARGGVARWSAKPMTCTAGGPSAGSLEEEDELLVELDEVATIGRSQFAAAGQLVMATWAPLAEQYQVRTQQARHALTLRGRQPFIIGLRLARVQVALRRATDPAYQTPAAQAELRQLRRTPGRQLRPSPTVRCAHAHVHSSSVCCTPSGKVVWLIYLIAKLVGARSSVNSADVEDELDGRLTGMVLQTVALQDAAVSQVRRWVGAAG